MFSRGIISKVRDKEVPFSFGFRGGVYVGAPGKDVYFVLRTLDISRHDELAKSVANLFPRKAPSNHVGYAAFVRYVYGCFEKQGCLRSRKDKRRLINEKPDWTISTQFMERVANFAIKNDNKYALIIHYEMLAHRLGDLAVIKNDLIILPEMEKHYLISKDLALKINSYKHMFTSYYWCAKYFAELNQIETALKYFKRTLKAMEKYCPDARDGYKEKARDSISYFKNNTDAERWKSMTEWLKKCKNICLRKVVKKL